MHFIVKYYQKDDAEKATHLHVLINQKFLRNQHKINTKFGWPVLSLDLGFVGRNQTLEVSISNYNQTGGDRGREEERERERERLRARELEQERERHTHTQTDRERDITTLRLNGRITRKEKLLRKSRMK